MNRGLAVVGAALLLALGAWSGWVFQARAAGAFSDWAAVVVAGDFHTHSGESSEAFDNARREVARELVGVGFSPSDIHQFSVRPERYPDEHLMISEPGLIGGKLAELASQAHGGCLIYFSSHGSPDGVLVGLGMLTPAGLSEMVDDACVIQSLPQAADFADLARRAQVCVADREKATGMTPPSEPQLFIGSELKPLIAFYPFDHVLAAAGTPTKEARVR